mmetsp:Transcript_24891/g.51444  ORF Transcript_24891/g.51444 Transcript_24891/m.51444 type:complete len:386 (-) Transcript_24891:217-1374(-)
MALEFPSDTALYVNSTGSAQQFMAGEWLLVAPVYSPELKRDGIYFPSGADWFDWWSGELMTKAGATNGTTLDSYDAPLDILPLFVRSGAIIPLWPADNYFDETLHDSLSLDIWPQGDSSFVLYEDDGITRAALDPDPEFATTAITSRAPADFLTTTDAAENVTLTVFAVQGKFDGQLDARTWRLNVRAKVAPSNVLLNGEAMYAAPSEISLEASASGWFYDEDLQTGLLMVKTPVMTKDEAFTVTLGYGSSFEKVLAAECNSADHNVYIPAAQQFVMNSAGQIVSQLYVTEMCLSFGDDNDPDSGTPECVLQPCSQCSKCVFVHDDNGQLKSGGSCIDQDATVQRLISYPCHEASAPGNQAWTFDARTLNLMNQQTGACATAASG